VTEFVGGQAGSTDSSIELFPETTTSLPVEAFAGLGDFSGDLDGVKGGRAIAAFADPTLSEDPNPAELAVEAVAYSRDEASSFSCGSETAETRAVLLTSDDLGVTEDGDENLVISRTFIDGALLVWTDDATRNLVGASAGFTFSIVQISTTGAETVVFEAEVTIEGEPDGETQLSHSSILDVEFGGPEVLEGLGGTDTQAVIASLEEIGRVHVALLPTQAVDYAYFATAGEAFELRATARGEAVNLPDGTGAAVVFGREFSSLEFALAPFTDQAKGAAIQAAVNRAVRVTHDGDDHGPLSPLCGALGLNSLALALVGLAGLRCARRRGL